MFRNIFIGATAAAFWLALFRYLGGFMCALVVLGAAWHFLGPEKPEASNVLQAEANQAIVRTIHELREKRGDIKHVAVLHFTNDVTDYLTLTLRHELSTSGIFNVDDTCFQEKLNNLLSLRNTGCFSVEKALEYGKDNDLDGVIIGSIDRFESLDQKDVTLTGKVLLLDVRTGRTVAEISLEKPPAPSFTTKVKGALELTTDADPSSEGISFWSRFLIFVFVVLLLPIITIQFLRYMVAKRSNKCNAFVLATYTLLGAILAFFMVGGALSSFGTTILFLMAVVFSLAYNYFLMSFALKLES